MGVKAATALGFAAGMLISPRLWCGARTFPRTPVFGDATILPDLASQLIYYLMIGLLAVVAILPRPRWAIAAFLGCLGVMWLDDQQRWQPWIYQYGLMLAALMLYPWRIAAGPGGAALNACRVIVAFIYIWSGIQKFNLSFFQIVGPWLLEPMLGRHVGPMLPLVMPIPFVEALLGVGLLVRPLRPWAAAGAVAMHLFILWSIGPFFGGHHWNTVVWPWNVAMIVLVPMLFLRTPAGRFRQLLWPAGAFAKVVLILVGVMPALSFHEIWDKYLSAALYSGNTLNAMLEIPTSIRDSLPADIADICEPAGEPGRWQLDYLAWTMADLNVPPNPARRVFRHTAAEFSRRWPGAPIRLHIAERPPASSIERKETVEDFLN